ncbi:MAG: hypothetical protein IKB70_03320 [Bacilli bacterium]|nr:hypothetical protein [Bacilli bacterium]
MNTATTKQILSNIKDGDIFSLQNDIEILKQRIERIKRKNNNTTKEDLFMIWIYEQNIKSKEKLIEAIENKYKELVKEEK